MGENLQDFDIAMMRLALLEASAASAAGEVPVGCVLVCHSAAPSNQIVAKSHNLVESTCDATAHAELLAIKDGSQKLKRWRLDDCSLYVTLEPCAMCCGAIRLARISRVVFGASDSRFGAALKPANILMATKVGPIPEVVGNCMSKDCSTLLKDFFKGLREN